MGIGWTQSAFHGPNPIQKKGNFFRFFGGFRLRLNFLPPLFRSISFPFLSTPPPPSCRPTFGKKRKGGKGRRKREKEGKRGDGVEGKGEGAEAASPLFSQPSIPPLAHPLPARPSNFGRKGGGGEEGRERKGRKTEGRLASRQAAPDPPPSCLRPFPFPFREFRRIPKNFRTFLNLQDSFEGLGNLGNPRKCLGGRQIREAGWKKKQAREGGEGSSLRPLPAPFFFFRP